MIARLDPRTAWRFTKRSSPVLLDFAGFVAITIGVWLLAGNMGGPDPCARVAHVCRCGRVTLPGGC
jgi:hypothetical protein